MPLRPPPRSPDTLVPNARRCGPPVAPVDPRVRAPVGQYGPDPASLPTGCAMAEENENPAASATLARGASRPQPVSCCGRMLNPAPCEPEPRAQQAEAGVVSA